MGDQAAVTERKRKTDFIKKVNKKATKNNFLSKRTSCIIRLCSEQTPDVVFLFTEKFLQMQMWYRKMCREKERVEAWKKRFVWKREN